MRTRIVAVMVVGFVLLAGATGGLLACRREAGPGAGSAPRKLTVAVPTEPPDGLDPHLTVAAATFQITRNIYDTLVEVTPEGAIVDGLARHWKQSPDGCEWTFYLRKNVYFHNGRKMTSRDVKSSFSRILNPATKHPRAKDYAVIEEILTPDDWTVTFVLRELSVAFLSNLAMGWAAIVPEEQADSLRSEPVGTGPFRFVEWRPEQHIKLARFDKYYGSAAIRLDEVVFKFIPEDAMKLVALRSGDVDVSAPIPPESARELASTPGFRVESAPMNAVQLMAMNNDRGPFTDRRVRWAVSCAVDKQAVVDGAMWGYGTVIGSHMPPVSEYYVDLSGKCRRDVVRAKQLLAEAGYPDGFRTKIYLPQPYDLHRRAGEIIASQLAEVGIKADLEVIEWGKWLEQVYYGRNYELTVIGHTGRLDPDPFLNRYTSGSKENYMNYRNDRYDELIQVAASTPDVQKRKEIYASLQNMLAEDAVALYIQSPHALVGMKEKVRGWRFFPIDIIELRYVYLED